MQDIAEIEKIPFPDVMAELPAPGDAEMLAVGLESWREVTAEIPTSRPSPHGLRARMLDPKSLRAFSVTARFYRDAYWPSRIFFVIWLRKARSGR